MYNTNYQLSNTAKRNEENKMNAQSIFDAATAAVNSPDNWKLDTISRQYPTMADAKNVAAFLAIEDAIAESKLSRKEQRQLSADIRGIAQPSIDSKNGSSALAANVAAYLMQPEIEAISVIVNNAINGV